MNLEKYSFGIKIWLSINYNKNNETW